MLCSEESFKHLLFCLEREMNSPERFERMREVMAKCRSVLRERANILAEKIYNHNPGKECFDQFLERTCPMNETDIGDQKTEKHAALGFAYGAGAPSNSANYAREVLVRELTSWRAALDNVTRRVNETQAELAAQMKLQYDARQRVASLETALRTV